MSNCLINEALFYLRQRNHFDGSAHRVGAIKLVRPVGSDLVTCGYSLCNPKDRFSADFAYRQVHRNISVSKVAVVNLGYVAKKDYISWVDFFAFIKEFESPVLVKRFDVEDLTLNACSFAGALKHIGLRPKVTK